ncbi:MAG: hypothetical protein V3V95_01335 [Thermodesulfobacteriota bacterium]
MKISFSSPTIAAAITPFLVMTTPIWRLISLESEVRSLASSAVMSSAGGTFRR